MASIRKRSFAAAAAIIWSDCAALRAIGFSTSGNSENVVRALTKAKDLGLATVAMTGEGGGKCAALADVLIDVPSRCTPRIQEMHILIGHMLCDLIEMALIEAARAKAP